MISVPIVKSQYIHILIFDYSEIVVGCYLAIVPTLGVADLSER